MLPAWRLFHDVSDSQWYAVEIKSLGIIARGVKWCETCGATMSEQNCQRRISEYQLRKEFKIQEEDF